MDTTINVQLTNQDINNIMVLINKAEIKGSEAMAVAILQDKLSNAVKSSVEPKIDPQQEKEAEVVDKQLFVCLRQNAFGGK